MHFVINGNELELEFDPRTSLLDLLREQRHLFGAKKGCNQGACGACTVLVNGTRINSLPRVGGAVFRLRNHHD